MSRSWRQVRPCPICGGKDRCSRNERGSICCYRADKKPEYQHNATVAGYVRVEVYDKTAKQWRERPAGDHGEIIFELEAERERRLSEAAAKKGRAKEQKAARRQKAVEQAQAGGLGPEDAAKAVQTAEERAEYEAAQAAAGPKAKATDDSDFYRQKAIKEAREIWRDARGGGDDKLTIGTPEGFWDGRGEDHPRVRAYLSARGIPVKDFPSGRVPATIRYHGECPRHGGADGESPTDTCPAMVAAFALPGKQEVVGVQRIFLDRAGEPRKVEGDRAKLEKGSFSGGGAVRLTKPGTVSGTLIIAEGVETALAILAAVPHGVAVWSMLSTSGMIKCQLPEGDAAPKVGWVKRVIIAGDLDELKRDGKRPGAEAAVKCATRLREQWDHLSVAVLFPTHELAPEYIEENGSPKGKTFDWLDVLRLCGAEVVRKGLIKGHVETEPPGGPLPETRTERAKEVLKALFVPGRRAGQTWRLRRYAGKWWTYRQTGRPRWVEESAPEEIEAVVGAYLDTRQVLKRGVFKPAALSGGAVKDVMGAVVNFTAARAEQMPVWLDPSFDEMGQPTWGGTISFDDLDGETPIKAEHVIAARNGLMDSAVWCKGQVRMLAPTTRWFSRSCLPFEIPVAELEAVKYDPDDDADERALCARLCPQWLAFLDFTFDRDPDSIETLQRWFGYCLTSDCKYQKVLWLQGPPGTGKGTITDVLAEVVGADNVGTSSFNNLAERFDLSSLVGRNVIFVPEVQMGRADSAAALEVFKAITGNSPVRVEDKYASVKNNVRITGKWVITPNEEPKFSDASAALMRRLVVLVTRNKVERPDETLGDRLRAERVGVLCWALFGLRRLEALRTFIQPAAGQELKDEMRRSMSPVSAWAEDECVMQAGSRVTTELAWKLYKRWAEGNGLGEMGRGTFGAKLRAALPQVARAEMMIGGVRQYWYVGMRPWMPDEARDKAPAAYSIDSLNEGQLGFQ